MKPGTFAPAYCALYPQLAELARAHGYALAVHGSLARDFDLIAVPWGERLHQPEAVVADIVRQFAVRQIGEPELKRHGRLAYTLSIGFGECSVDLSFVPVLEGGSLPGNWGISVEAGKGGAKLR